MDQLRLLVNPTQAFPRMKRPQGILNQKTLDRRIHLFYYAEHMLISEDRAGT